MPRVRVIAGTARSNRAARIDALLAESPDRSLLIVPTERHAQLRIDALLHASGRAALLDPPVVTFEGLVGRILRGSPLEHARIDALGQHLLLRRVIDRVAASGALETIGMGAQTEGFLDHLLRVVGQLKQAAIEPEEFEQRIKSARRRNPMDRVVAAVYAAYQEELHRANAVDLQGMYWLARNVCEASCPAALQPVGHLVLDEFDDFTPSEFRVIQVAARHVDGLTIGLNADLGPAQTDLYAIPRATLDRVRDAFGEMQVEALEEPATSRATEFIASSLLVRDEIIAPDPLEPNLDLAEFHTIDHEIESIARRIKRLIRDDGVAPGEIALVFRNVGAVQESVLDVFAEFDVPVSFSAPRPADRSALAGYLIRFIDAARTWSEASVADALTSPWFAGPGAPHAGAFATLIRAARPRAARASWERALGRLANAIADPQVDEVIKLVEHMPRATDACAALQSAFASFCVGAEALSRACTVAEFAAQLDALLDRLPVEQAIGGLTDDEQRRFEGGAREAIRRGLFQLHENDRVNGGRRASLGEFAALLRRTLAVLTVHVAGNARGVACLDMESARYLRFEYTFFAGVTDANVPARVKSSALYTEDERAELRNLGVPLDDPREHDRREMLLFQRMFANARRRLTVSWHTIERGGSATQRSLYIEEIAERLPELAVQKPGRPVDVIVPSPELVACERDLRNVAFADGSGPAAAACFPEIAAAMAIERRRLATSPFDEHDGVLASRENLAIIAADFGPDAVFSATALEDYAACPFSFFQRRVLNLFAIEPTEQTLDRRVEGSVLHRALEQFHRAHRGMAVADIPADTAEAAMLEALEKAFDQAARRYVHLARGLLAAERAKLGRVLRQYLAIARDEDDLAWKPSDFEVVFGDRGENGEGTPPYHLALEGSGVFLRGRIDRVDERPGAVRLVDYKSSEVTPAEIKRGRAFQLALYALAVESVLRPGTPCDAAVYLAVGKEKATVALARGDKNADWDERVTTARDAVLRALAGIRAARFHPTTDEAPCKACADEKACRFQKARMRRKADA